MLHISQDDLDTVRERVIRSIPAVAYRDLGPGPDTIESCLTTVISAYSQRDMTGVRRWLDERSKPASPAALSECVATVLGVLQQLQPPLDGTILESISKSAEHHRTCLDNEIRPNEHQREHEAATLFRLLELTDPRLAESSEAVGALARRLALDLELAPHQVANISLAGRLHQIGRVLDGRAPHDLRSPIDNDPNRTLSSTNLIAQFDALRDLVPTVLHHLEHFDGSGQPDGLLGEAIPLESRIIAIATVFHRSTFGATTHEPPAVERSAQHLQDLAGTVLDPELVVRFLRMIGYRRPLTFITGNVHDED